MHGLIDFDLSVEEGEAVALVGASGSGKSTAMNIMGLLDSPDCGQYLLNGQNVLDCTSAERANVRSNKFGFVFQSYYLLGRFDVIDNVGLPLVYQDIDRAQRRDKSRELLARLELSELGHKYPNQLSGGQQQRVALARALIASPTILFADEPTGALDSKTGQFILDLILELQRSESLTVIMVTHDQSLAQQMGHSINLADGKVIHAAS